MDIQYLKKVLGLFDASTARELEIEEEDIKIKISRNGGESQMQVQQPMQMQYAQQPQMSAPPAPQQVSDSGSNSEQKADSGLLEVTSPIVGTFYRAPAPDSDPFVEIGSKVTVGSTLCIIEAMKLMNEIESDVSGTVQEIVLKDSEAVEFGQVLFRIKPD